MQHVWKHIRWIPVLMTITILGITAFQLYWLKKAYDREKRTVEIRSNMAFRDAVHSLQASKLKLDRLGPDTSDVPDSFVRKGRKVKMMPDEKTIELIRVLNDKNKAVTRRGTTIILGTNRADSTTDTTIKKRMQRRDRLMQFLYDVESPQDTVRVAEIDTAFKSRIDAQNIRIPFSIKRLPKASDEEREFNKVTVGFRYPITYQLTLGNLFPYLIKRIAAPALLSLFLVAFSIVSFTLLYRNLVRQRRLADIKNEFISNITHELKTPIATVSVAIEALRSFNANMDPQKTKEYLDISANELQRLSLLVDKVLKLSMFEKREVELKYEQLDMKELVNEVTSSMRLQFEKHNATVNVQAEGNTELMGDRLHLVSVIFNLVDNAIKYSKEDPSVNISIRGNDKNVSLSVEDAGIGVPHEYHERIFEKFFRVPTGNLHNAKGYGLGLSYAAHVIKKHKGTIKCDSVEGNGSRFIISLPKGTS